RSRRGLTRACIGYATRLNRHEHQRTRSWRWWRLVHVAAEVGRPVPSVWRTAVESSANADYFVAGIQHVAAVSGGAGPLIKCCLSARVSARYIFPSGKVWVTKRSHSHKRIPSETVGVAEILLCSQVVAHPLRCILKSGGDLKWAHTILRSKVV